MNIEEMKTWIDGASYEELLSKWRFAGCGDAFFMGEVGIHYSNVLEKKCKEVGDVEHTRISKKLGWK